MKFSNYKSKTFKAGAIFTITTVLVIVIVILLNTLVYIIPTKYTHIDTTYEKLFTLSEQTQTLLTGLSEEISIYHLCAGAVEDENISELLKKYSSLSPSITVTVKDTSLYPNFHLEYTDEDLANNSLIVVGAKRNRIVSYYDIYKSSSAEYEYYEIYDVFNGESALTSAIDYVISDNLPKMYYTEGHSESMISDTLKDLIKQENIELSSLTLNGLESIPDDADCILMFSPSRDISVTEKNMFIEYMSNGGKMIIVSYYTENDMPQFNELLKYYSLKLEKGIVFESDGSKYVPKYPYFIYPNIQSHTVTDPIINENLHILFPLSQGIVQTDEVRETITVEELITTNDTSYSKIDISSETSAKEDQDISGPFALAVAVTEQTETATSQLILFSTSQFLDENVNSSVAGANYDLFLNSIGWLCEKESSIAVHSKDIYSTSVAVPDTASRLIFILIVILIPAIFIIIAAVVTKIRKNR